MTVEFVSSCFTNSYFNSLDQKVEDYLDDFAEKNSNLNLTLPSQKFNKNLFDKLFLLRFSLYEKIYQSRILCSEDQVVKKSVYSILALPSLILDLAVNNILAQFKLNYKLFLISGIGANLLYKKISKGKDFDHVPTLQSISYNFLYFYTYVIYVLTEITQMSSEAFFLNQPPFSRNRKEFVAAQLPLASFENIEDNTVTIAFAQARYAAPWKDYSDQQLFELLNQKCQKFRYSVQDDCVKIYSKVGYKEVSIILNRAVKVWRRLPGTGHPLTG